MPEAAWILPAALTLSLSLAVWKLQKWQIRYTLRELKWFVFLALLVFPLSFLNFRPFDGQLLTLNGKTTEPVVMALSALPVFGGRADWSAAGGDPRHRNGLGSLPEAGAGPDGDLFLRLPRAGFCLDADETKVPMAQRLEAAACDAGGLVSSFLASLSSR